MVIFFAVEEIQTLLQSELAKICSMKKLGVLKDTPFIDYVPLQMTQYQENITTPDSDHQYNRKEIQTLYKKHPMGDILPEQFFEKSRDFAKKSEDFKRKLTSEAKESYLNKHGNVVGVIGQAGVGKTTFSKILLKDILSKKENSYQADYIFYVRLRDFQNQNKINLLNFLLKTITPDLVKTIHFPKNFLHHLLNSNSVVIILDGFDEIDFPQFSNFDFSMYGENSPQYFTLGLISGEILPKAKKVITSRPRQLLDLSSKFKPIFLVSILGIDHQGQKQIFKDICKNEERKQDVWDYIQSQTELNSHCYVPIMAILIFHTIYQIFNSQNSDQKTPTSMAQILAYNLYLFIRTDHVHRNETDVVCKRHHTKIKLESLSKLSKLAYEGIVNKKIYFSDEDFQEASLKENDINTFFITFYGDDPSNAVYDVERITKKLSYFSHLIWQEFFAAIHMIFKLKSEDFKVICSNSPQIDLSSSRFEVVTKFLFGLCNENTIKILKSIDDSYFFSPDQQTKFLKKHLHSRLANTNIFYDTKQIFLVASLLYELKDKNLTLKFSNFLPNILTIFGDILPNNVLPFCELIGVRQHDLELKLFKAQFYENSGLLFFKKMEQVIADSLYIKVNIYFIFIVLTQ